MTSQNAAEFSMSERQSPNQSINQIFVYCVNVNEKTVYILIIAVTDASMIYREKVPEFILFYFTISKDPYDKLGGMFNH